MDFLKKSVGMLNGVGKTREVQLNKLGIYTIRDLVYFFPRSYEMRGNVKKLSEVDGACAHSVILTVGTAVKGVRVKSGRTIYKFKAFDDTGAVEIVFFNSPYVKTVFTTGAVFRFYGKFSYSGRQLQMISPKYEPFIPELPLADLIPIYPLTEGLSSKIIDKLVLSVLDEAIAHTRDYLPEDVRIRNSLPTLSFALKAAHFPKSEEELAAALRRLAFDEMLFFGLGIALQSRFKTKGVGIPFSPCSLKPLIESLPYELTDDQKNAVNDIYRDTVIKKPDGTVSPMSRIIVGDVGSGKTICAVMAIYIAAKSKMQTALMVPTEILARQHFESISKLLSPLGIRTELLLGSTGAKERRRIYESIETGEADLVIGTHALLSDKLNFASLGLVITDEQHRFGVAQRATLKEKSSRCHMLVMSATPIPRTLALTMYGDLDVSRIAQMPNGRIPVETYVVNESYRQRLNDFIRKQVALGGQCYVVCPAIEQKSEDDDSKIVTPGSITSPFSEKEPLTMKSATEHTESLKAELPELAVECLHGKLKISEKNEIMKRFEQGQTKVLVSTTVIEVGVNVPNACVMIIESADRFGLSSLHQLRGRVGRGSKKSYCILVSDSKSEKSMQRLSIMKSTTNGFEIAERDLVMRGPGDFFSSNSADSFRQSGGFTFKFAKLCDDNALFESAFSEAKYIIEHDADLSLPQHVLLRAELGEISEINSSTIS